MHLPPHSRYLFLACLLALILAIILGGRKAPIAESVDKPPEPPALVVESPLADQITPVEPIPEVAMAAETAAPEPVEPNSPKVSVKRTISEQWIDAPSKQAARQRVRIVEADFKYPRLRLEESVTTDPDTGLETATLLRASVADHLLLGLKSGADSQLAAAAIREMGYSVRAIEPESHILAELPMFDTAKDHVRAAADLAALEEFIDHAEPDYLVFPCLTPNDPAYSQGKMWGLHNPGTGADATADADIDAPEGWAIRKDAPGIIVAVTDTGIQYNHEDLKENMWSDPFGSHGFDAYDDDSDPMDVGGHGTHCAGTIGARGDNGTGLTGVAWDVQLMAVRFLGPNGGTTSDAIRSVNYSRQNGAHIISASWGGGGYSQSLFNAIKACADAGIPFVAAAGNSSANNDATPQYPSSYKLENIVAVASTTKKDTLSTFSCYGRTSVDIAAPGSGIWSTYIGSNNSYTFLNGTSMATPHVSGALALAMVHFPGETMENHIARLYESVDKLPSLIGKVATGGRLNLARLLGGAPPNVFNDDFADAHRFEGAYGTWVGSNVGATREPDEDTFAKPGTGNKSLWYAFRTPHAGLVSVDVVGEILGFEAVVFEGGEKGQLEMVAYSDRLGDSYRYLRFNAKADTEYRIVVDTYASTRHRFRVDYNISPPNDFFADASELSGDFFSVKGTNRGATSEAFENGKPHGGTGQGKSVWWKWTAPEDGDFIINTSGSAFDTVLAVYTGASANSLTEVAANEDRSPLDWTSQVTLSAVAGTEYHIAVDSFRADSQGDIKLNGFRSGLLTILRQPTDLTVEVGKRAEFNVSVFSGSDVRYQWFLNDQSIPGKTAANLVIDPVRASDFGNYKVEVRNTENLLLSDTAVLVEKLTAPQLVWSSGNQAVAPGTTVTLAATYSGSSPITFDWTKNGSPISGDKDILEFPAAQIADAGTYRLTATNSVGSVTTDFNLFVIQSPWDRWEWRRPGIPNAAITDIKVYGGEAFGVAANTLFRTTDGVTWAKSTFPQGFVGNSIEKAGSRFICLGTDITGAFRIAVSTNNAATWSINTASGFAVTFQPEKSRLISHGGAFIAKSASGQDVLRSADGLTWSRLMATNLSGQNVNLTGNGNIATDGQTLILASATTSFTDIRYFRSTNGTSWTEYRTSAGRSFGGNTAFHDGNSFQLWGGLSVFTSTNGVDWVYRNQTSQAPVPPPFVTIRKEAVMCTNGSLSFGFHVGTQSFAYFSDDLKVKSRHLTPPDAGMFTAAASFNGKILYGTDKGYLGYSQDELGVSIPVTRTPGLKSLEFTENLFIARAASTATGVRVDSVSGDGITWKTITPTNQFSGNIAGSYGGKYYGTTGGFGGFHSGHNPFDIRYSLVDSNGIPPVISFIGELPDGGALAISTPSSETSSLYARAPGAASWSPATFPISLSYSSKFVALGNRWYSNSGALFHSPAQIYTSQDGTNWTSIGISAVNAHFAAFAGKNWCIYQSATSPYQTFAASSSDGVSWSGVAVTGLPTNITYFARRVVVFGSYMVMIGADEALYYSENGTAWVRGAAPGKVIDVASGNGQLIALMKNGGLVQTGSPHVGVSAPRVSILSPASRSSHLLGSRVTIEGAVTDTEDGIATYECSFDGQVVATGSGNSFRFHVTPTSLDGHTVTVRAIDSQGLRQIDTIRLNVVAPEPTNLIAEPDEGGLVWQKLAMSHQGLIYIAGDRSLHRSPDGEAWERVPIPLLPERIVGMASGEGALVLQLANGMLLTTRDGVNWFHFAPEAVVTTIRVAVRYESGVFITSFSTDFLNGTVMTSRDGIAWETAEPGKDAYLDWVAGNGQGTMIGCSMESVGLRRSIDGGNNWLPVPIIQTATRFNSTGVYGDGKFVVAVHGASKAYRSVDAIEWTEESLPASINKRPDLSFIGGMFFLGKDSILTHSSVDGSSWVQMSHPVQMQRIAHASGVFVAQASNGGLVTSTDGFNWHPEAVQNMPPALSFIVSNDGSFMVVDSTGGLWASTDGFNWTNTTPGGVGITGNSGVGMNIADYQGKLVVAGRALLVTRPENQSGWQDATVDGNPPSASTTYQKIVAGSNALVALKGPISNTFSADSLIRSTDGTAFTTVPGLPAKTWADIAWNGAEWMLLATDGALLRSSDDGISWIQVAAAGMARGAGLAWFNSRWVMIGSDTAGFNTPYMAFTLGTGDALTNNGTIGFFNSSRPVSSLVAHGKLVIWQQGDRTLVSSNGTNWTLADHNAGVGGRVFDIHSTADGFTAHSYSSTTFSELMWTSGKDGLSWQVVPSTFNNIQFSENLGDRIFLFASNYIAELHDKDLALTLPATAPVTLGVGDEVSVDVTIRNFGRAIPPGGVWKVSAWLAKNRFYGDTKNIPLGVFEITSPMPAPGASESYPVAFTLPNAILTGDNYLILQLTGPDEIRETNTANNTVISDTAFIRIPEWEFSVATNGNGQVNRDFAAARYPHNAQVSLTASAGKGATFTGWGGDAFSPNDQITVLMDGDKSVQANFSNRATLQLFISGLGEVTGLADLGSYPLGEIAQITAMPAPGWEFSHWSGASSLQTPAASIPMDAPKTATAHFILPMATWKSARFTTEQLVDHEISGDLMDPDGDGVPNWKEYLHGSHPMEKDSTGASPITIENGYLRCVYTRNVGAEGGASLTCQAGRGLADWDAPDLQERILNTADGIQTVEARIPVSGQEMGFIRFRYVAAQP